MILSKLTALTLLASAQGILTRLSPQRSTASGATFRCHSEQRKERNAPLWSLLRGGSARGDDNVGAIYSGGYPGENWSAREEGELLSQLSRVTSEEPPAPLVLQYKPIRSELWLRFKGTVLETTWRSMVFNMILSAVACIVFRRLEAVHPEYHMQLEFVDKLWHTLMTLATLVLTFFVGQGWALWQKVCGLLRSVQGNLNDMNLVLSTHAVRGKDGGLGANKEWIEQFARYTRLWHVLYFAAVSRKHALLATSRGLQRLCEARLLTDPEKTLLERAAPNPSARHTVVLLWMSSFVAQGFKEGRFVMPSSSHMCVLEKLMQLRSNSGTVAGELVARIKMAYVHIVQMLVDVFLLLTPFAQYTEVGFWSIIATGILTCFYQGLLNLSKTFLDPLDNEKFPVDSDPLNLDTIIIQSNTNSKLYVAAVDRVPA